MKLWGGRFSQATHKEVDAFNASIPFDYRMYAEDIEGSMAHSKMLHKQGFFSDEELKAVETELTSLKSEIEAGKIDWNIEYEDIHMHIEALLTEKLGATAKKIHTARSRNDQVALDFKLYAKKQAIAAKEQLTRLVHVLTDIAAQHTETILPGFTHLQHAQPITLAHHLMAYVEMFLRDIDRMDSTLQRMNLSPLGAGALATTTLNIDPLFTAKELGFTGVMRNSLDAVSDRDYLLELMNHNALIMMHLSRFSEELIIWNSTEFSYIRFQDAFATGSSMMPQKKNPDLPELIRGKTGRVYGSLVSLLTTMKALPLAYNKDMQEDKEAFFNSSDTVSQCLSIFTFLFDEGILFNKENMLASAKKGYLNATDLADYLVERKIPFRDAHHIVGELVALAIAKGLPLEELSLEDFQSIHPQIESGVYAFLELDACINRRNQPGGPAPNRVLDHIHFVKSNY
ncbi:argininosuccinate lyase [Gottschalkiaceae bacterium SANA]|nr:argininosuccinate lyase [Gottschalkiaceae bacterium SANA]